MAVLRRRQSQTRDERSSRWETNKVIRPGSATIQFEQTAGKALEAGRLREAVVAYHELLQKYPEDFVRHTQFAAAVLPLGLGELARTHARRAVELAPTEFYAWSTLGHVLAHNQIGQFLAPGFDRAGAADGYRKALELRPDDVAARWQLGQLLSYDEQGLRYSNPEYVDAAIAELAAAYAKQKHEQLLDSLASAMYFRGKAADARKLLESETSSPTRDLHLLLGIAITESLDACVTRAAEMRPVDTERQAMLEQLVGVLSYFREYRTAAELARQVAATSTQKDFFLLRADRLGRLSRYEPEQGPLEDPIGFVRFVLANSFIHGTASSQLQRFFVNVPDEIDEAFDSGMPCWIDALRKAFLDENLPPARIADIVAEFDFSATEGGADCHRVAVTSKSLASFSWTAIVLRGEQGLRLYRPGQDQSEFGREALNLLTKGREDDARRWLDWAFDEQRQDTSTFSRIFDQFAGSPFVRLWAAGKKDQRDVQLAATALVLMGDSPEQPLLAFLEENRAELEAARQLQVDRALVEGYAKAGDYQKLAGLAATLCQKHPRTFEPAIMEMLARARLQDLNAVEDLIKKHASSVEIRVFGQLTLAEAAMAAGNAVKASEVLSALAEQKDSIPPIAITHTAWLSLFQHPVPPGTLALAKGGLEKAPPAESPQGRYLQRTASMPFVLALIDAGQFAEAVQALHAMPATDPDGRANSFDKLALGWIADKCGLHEHARKLLQEVRRSTSREPNTVYDLAQKRLELIGGAPHDDEGTAD